MTGQDKKTLLTMTDRTAEQNGVRGQKDQHQKDNPCGLRQVYCLKVSHLSWRDCHSVGLAEIEIASKKYNYGNTC